MFSAITNIYNKKTKGPTLMEFFTATEKLKVFVLTSRECSTCAPRVTRGTSLDVKKKVFLWLWKTPCISCPCNLHVRHRKVIAKLPALCINMTSAICLTCLLSYLLTPWGSPSWEANRFSASQEIPRILWNTRFITALTSARHLSLF
jgi:hypothetical protein